MSRKSSAPPTWVLAEKLVRDISCAMRMHQCTNVPRARSALSWKAHAANKALKKMKNRG